MDENTIKTALEAARESASTAGKIVDQLGKLGNYFEGMLREFAGTAEDNARFRRLKNRFRIYDKTQKLLAQRGTEMPTREVPIKLVVPLLAYGSLEEDDELQDTWAQLLANASDASSGVELRTTYVDVLKDMNALDVKILAMLGKLSSSDFPQITSPAIETGELPTNAQVQVYPKKVLSQPSEEVRLSLSNLVRAGCISTATGYGGGHSFELAFMTPLGMGLYRACVK